MGLIIGVVQSSRGQRSRGRRPDLDPVANIPVICSVRSGTSRWAVAGYKHPLLSHRCSKSATEPSLMCLGPIMAYGDYAVVACGITRTKGRMRRQGVGGYSAVCSGAP
jgi:hypothetical protein